MFTNALTARRGPLLSRLIMAGFALLPTIASAHPGHYHPPGEVDEFEAVSAGFAHPFSGMDHLVLALAAGWLAFAWKGGKSRVPFLAFLGALAVGAVAGRGIQAGAGLETALALTLMVAGAAFLVGINVRLGVFATAVSLVGFVHGFAHGSEAAANVPFLSYATGFTAATAVLLGAGGLLQLAASKFRQPLIPRLAGCALIAFGSVSLFQAL